MAGLPTIPTENAMQTTLDAQLNQGATSATLANDYSTQLSGVSTSRPAWGVIDRVDNNGLSTPSKREYIKITGVSGQTITIGARGEAGSTDQVHSVGAIFEIVSDVSSIRQILSAFSTEHSATDGTHTSALVTTLKATGAEVTTGTEDAKIVTPKALKDSGLNIDSGSITIDGTSSGGAEIRLAEDTDNGTNYVSLKAPATLSADKTFILPSADGTAGQVLKTDGSANLSFTSVAPTLLYNGQRTGGNITVSSITSAYGDIGNEWTTTQSTTGGLVQVNVIISLTPNVGSYPQTTRINLRVDSTDYLLGYLGQTGNIVLGAGYSIMISGLSAGSHTFKVQVGYNATGSTIVIGDASSGARLQIIEYPV